MIPPRLNALSRFLPMSGANLHERVANRAVERGVRGPFFCSEGKFAEFTPWGRGFCAGNTWPGGVLAER
jgi:hypothetical protein